MSRFQNFGPEGTPIQNYRKFYTIAMIFEIQN